MSYQNGMAALKLEMPDVVPRTEYSAEGHWALIQRITGIKVDATSEVDVKIKASAAFKKAWDYGLSWNILTYNEIFGEMRTKMGHAVYADSGVDYLDDRGALFSDPEDVFDFDLEKHFPVPEQKVLTAQYNENYRLKCQENVDMVNMTGIYVTMMSGLIELLGWDTLLMAAGIDAKAFGDFTNRYAAFIAPYFKALAKSEASVVMIHDDIVWTSGAFLHPDFYRQYIFPNYKKLFAPLHEAGKIILYTSDGDYTQFVDDVANCGVHGFVMEPMTDMAYIAQKYGKTHSFIGNADTRILLRGSKEEIYAEVKRCMDIGKKCPGFFLSVGNHIPANTPVDNALWYNDCYMKLRKR